MLKREVISFKKLPSTPNYSKLLVHVKTNIGEFIEGYVGVNKEHPYYANYVYTETRDQRYINMSNDVFKKHGCNGDSLRFDHNNSHPIYGAWLSYTRIGDPNIEGYEFQEERYFYYSAGFKIGASSLWTRKECNNAAETIIERMSTFLENPIPVNKTLDLTHSELENIVEISELKDKELFLFSSDKIIKRKLKDFKLVLYIFDAKINAKVWRFLGSNYFLNNFDKKIFKGKENDIFVDDNLFNLVYNLCKNKNFCKYLYNKNRLCVASYVDKLTEDYPDWKKEYWNKISSKLRNPIQHNRISKRDRHNLAKFIEYNYFKLERLKGTL